MKHHIMSYLSEMGHPVSSFEHNLLEKFAKFVADAEAKVEEPTPVAAVEEPAPVVETPQAEAPVAEETGTSATEDK